MRCDVLLGWDRFDDVKDLYEPVETGERDHVFMSKSYDAASHFETTAADVLSLYRRITKESLDLTIPD